jgi:hypothetical protein
MGKAIPIGLVPRMSMIYNGAIVELDLAKFHFQYDLPTFSQ